MKTVLVTAFIIAFLLFPSAPPLAQAHGTGPQAVGLDKADRIYVKIKARSFLGSVRPGTREQVMGLLLLTPHQYSNAETVLLFHNQEKAETLTAWLGMNYQDNPLTQNYTVEVHPRSDEELWQRWGRISQMANQDLNTNQTTGFAIEVLGHEGEQVGQKIYRQWAEESVLEALDAWGAAFQMQAPVQINLNPGLGLASDLMIAWMLRNSHQAEVSLLRSLMNLEIRGTQGQTFSSLEEFQASRPNSHHSATKQILERVPEEWSTAFSSQAQKIIQNTLSGASCQNLLVEKKL